MPALLLVLVQEAAEIASHATGLEWMVVASILVPALLLIVLLYLGARRTV